MLSFNTFGKSVHIQFQASIYTLSLCRGHSWQVWLAKQETLTPPGHLVSPLVSRGPWMSTVVLYCWCHSDSASVLLYFTFHVIEYGVFLLIMTHSTFWEFYVINYMCIWFFPFVFVIFNSTNNYFKDICWLCDGGNSVTTKGRKNSSEL